MAKQVAIYKGGAYDYAREHGEIAELRASLDANHAVQEYLRNDIGRYYVGGDRFNATQLMQDLKTEFGLDRAMHVMLASVNDWDRRFSKTTVDRATAEFYISAKTDNNPGDFERNFCYTDMHPVYLDEVIKKGLQMEREQELIRTDTPHYNLGETYKDLSGKEFKVVAELVEDGKQVSITGVDEKGWRFEIEPQFEVLNGSVVLTPVVEAPLTDSMIHDYWDYKTEQPIPMTFDDFKVGTTYLNHNGSPYTVLDKGMTYYDEPFIKVQSVNDNPDQAWTAWAVRPEIREDGTLEWAYSKDRDLTIDPENNINLEEQEMNETLSVTAHMTYLADVQQQDPKSNFVGLASISVAETYVISGIQVYQSTNDKYSNPFYASMPDMKGSDNDYHPVVFATAEAREAMSKAVSGAFIAAKEQGKNIENHYPTYSSALAPKQNAQEISAVIKGDTYQRDFKANANITLYGQFEVKGVKLITSKEGNDFISMPSQRDSKGDYHDLVFPITAEARDSIFAEINAKLADRAKIIGNVKYSDIQDKAYLVISANDIKGVTEVLENSGIGYSGKPHESGAYTITVERADIPTVDAITKGIHESAKPDRTDVENFAKTAEQTLEQTRENTAERGQ